LAVLLGVPTDHQQLFYSLAQERYQELIGRGEASSNALIKALDEAMAGYPMLAKAGAAHQYERAYKSLGCGSIFL